MQREGNELERRVERNHTMEIIQELAAKAVKQNHHEQLGHSSDRTTEPGATDTPFWPGWGQRCADLWRAPC